MHCHTLLIIYSFVTNKLIESQKHKIETVVRSRFPGINYQELKKEKFHSANFIWCSNLFRLLRMFLLENFAFFSKIFYCTGLAPFPTSGRTPQRYIFIALIITVSLLTNIGFLVISINFHSYKLYGNIEKIVSYSFVVSLVLSNLSANIQCYYYKAAYGRISGQIFKIENILQTKFSHNINFRRFSLRYKSKVFVITILLIIDYALKFFESLIHYDFKLFAKYCFSCMAQLMSTVIICHVLLYISIAEIFITELNQRIQSTPIRLTSSSKMELLKTIKLMHMQIWKLMTQINTFFSFNLTFYIVALAAQTTYYLYWLFLIMQVEWNLLYISRKNDELIRLSNSLLRKRFNVLTVSESLVIITHCLVRISLLVNGCESLSNEVKWSYLLWTHFVCETVPKIYSPQQMCI